MNIISKREGTTVARRALQLTVAILKPDVIANPIAAKEIRDHILRNQFYFVESRIMHMDKKTTGDFYNEHKGKFFYGRLLEYMSSGPLCVHILARQQAITIWRSLMGPTKVYRTIYEAPYSIRGRFGLTDTRNGTHGSDSEDTASREIDFFFPQFNADRWYRTEETHFREGRVYYDDYKWRHVLT